MSTRPSSPGTNLLPDTEGVPPAWGVVQRRALQAGLASLALCLLVGLAARERFFQAWLFAYLCWAGLSVGFLTVLVLHHVTGGSWGFPILRILEAGSRTLPLIVLLFLPLLAGLPYVYEWARPEVVAGDPILQHKQVYLNVPFFILRSLVHLGVWIGMALMISRWSAEQDRIGDPRLTQRLRSWCAPGMVVLVLTITFASIDWMMSLDPHWYSTIYGLLMLVGNGVGALAAAVVVAVLLSTRRPLSLVATSQRLYDLGNLLMALTLVWAYLAFSQYLIIWSGNLPEDIRWYLDRSHGLWRPMSLALIALHFVLPFALLLAPRNKRRPQALMRIGLLLLAARLVDMVWLVLPSLHRPGWPVHLLDLLALVGMGGLWVAVFIGQLRARPLVPWNDPRLQEVLESE